MVQLNAHFDGKAIVPDEKVELPTGVRLRITVEVAPSTIKNTEDDPFLKLAGLGEEIWEGIDGVEYQRREREGWE